MGFIKNLKISHKLNLLLGGLFVVVMLSVGFFALIKQREQSEQNVQEKMTTHLRDLNSLLSFFIDDMQKRESSNLSNIVTILNERIAFQDEEYELKGRFKSMELTDETETRLISVLKGTANFYNTEIVIYTWDGNNFTPCYADSQASFQKNDKIGIELQNNILNNKVSFEGVQEGKEWFYAGYTKLTSNGDIIGIVKSQSKSTNFKKIKETFYQHEYYKTGFPYLLDSKGNILVHPQKEGENILSSPIFQTIQQKGTNSGVFETDINGERIRAYFTFSPELNGYIIGSFTMDEFYKEIKKTETAVFIAILIGLFFFILMNRAISKNIISSLSKSVEFARNISEGNLQTKLEIEQKDEIGQLAIALKNMQDRLKEIISNILNGSNNIAAASHQISSGSEQMAQGANEQASSIEEVSTSIEQMNANIEQNSDNAAQSEKIASAMEQGVHEVAERAKKANDVNQMVSEKIKIISDIAFQTNLLALNAAVEAARAGEYGKGFAVVAAEVRKLAENSKVAAEEIVSLAEESFNLSSGAGEKLAEVMPIISKTVQLVQEIASSSSEQRSGSDQINSAIQQLNGVTQQNASASEELATSAEELASQASQLQEVSSYFNIGTKTNENLNQVQEFSRLNKNKKQKQTKLSDNPLQFEVNKSDNGFESF